MFKKIFIKLCSERGESPSFVCGKIGISAAAFSQWTDDTVPRKVTQQKTAEYFGVTVDQLLGKEPLGQKEKALDKKSNATFLDTANVHMIPLFESVSAGFGTLPNDSIQAYVPLYIESPIEAAETLCVKVCGDSMYPKIEHGDVIQIHKQESVDSGSIAVILVDGEESYVKRIIYGNNWIELQSINPMYPPMRFEGPDVLRVRVLGLVKKIIKSV